MKKFIKIFVCTLLLIATLAIGVAAKSNYTSTYNDVCMDSRTLAQTYRTYDKGTKILWLITEKASTTTCSEFSNNVNVSDFYQIITRARIDNTNTDHSDIQLSGTIDEQSHTSSATAKISDVYGTFVDHYGSASYDGEWAVRGFFSAP